MGAAPSSNQIPKSTSEPRGWQSPSRPSRVCPVGANPGISHWEGESYSRRAKMWFRRSVCPAGSEGKISWHGSGAGAAPWVGSVPGVSSSSAQPGLQHICQEKEGFGNTETPRSALGQPPKPDSTSLCPKRAGLELGGARAAPHLILHKSHGTIPYLGGS